MENGKTENKRQFVSVFHIDLIEDSHQSQSFCCYLLFRETSLFDLTPPQYVVKETKFLCGGFTSLFKLETTEKVWCWLQFLL